MVLDNYSVLQELWEESERLSKDSENTSGVAFQIVFYFGVCIGEMILRHSENLAKKISEGQQVASLVNAILQTMCSESLFNLFWQMIVVEEQIGKPTLPRKQKAPKKFEVRRS